MSRVVLVLIMLSSVATAAPKLEVTVTKVDDPKQEVDVALVTKALPKLASCGEPKQTPAAITVEVSAGAVTAVKIPAPHGAKFIKCATRALKRMKLTKSTGTGVVIAISVDLSLEEKLVRRNAPVSVMIKTDTTPPPSDPTTLTQDEVAFVMKTNARKFRECYSALLKKQPTLAGKFVYSIEIANGRVTQARAVTTTKQSTALDQCIVAEIKTLTFPSRPAKTITFPFVFSAAQ